VDRILSNVNSLFGGSREKRSNSLQDLEGGASYIAIRYIQFILENEKKKVQNVQNVQKVQRVQGVLKEDLLRLCQLYTELSQLGQIFGAINKVLLFKALDTLHRDRNTCEDMR